MKTKPIVLVLAALAAAVGSAVPAHAAVPAPGGPAPGGPAPGGPAAQAGFMSAPTAAQLKAALVRHRDGYRTLHVVAGKAATFTGRRSGMRGWAFSAIPPRCRTSGTTGLLWDRKAVHRFRGRPAAAVELSGVGHALGESLISVPASLPDSVFRARVPASCEKLRVSYNGRRIKVRIKPIPAAELPVIPGATVSGVKTVLPPLWGRKKPAELALVVVRSGPLVMETYADGWGSVRPTSTSWTTTAWERALATLRPAEEAGPEV
ncbi:hypothetical protein AB0L05_07200 [Nonomuraea pusilla]|uniref:hypothetical protein n=1 Tax=Nonomuraea pusilla TaxID=46177 RepID=UPI00332B4117